MTTTTVLGKTAGPSTSVPGVSDIDRTSAVWRRVVLDVARTMGWFVASIVTLATIWQISVRAFALSDFGARTSSQMWSYLVTADEAGLNRKPLVDALHQTMTHAGVGLGSGVLVGLMLALTFVVVPILERPLLPIILLTQSLPILAVLPLFILIFGRGFLVTIVITTLAVFFPVFILVSQGLRSVATAHLDYFRSLDASSLTSLIRLQMPSAVPNFFAALKVCVPAAMFGAIVSEWLATGNGLGHLMVNAAAAAGSYDLLWSAVAITTVFTMAVYTVIELIEQVVLSHFAPSS